MIEYFLFARESTDMERYRSGHNEAVLKTVCPKGRVGSNPTLSASDDLSPMATGQNFALFQDDTVGSDVPEPGADI